MDASQDSSVEDSEEEEPDLEAPGSQLGEQQDLRSRLRRRAVFLEGGISQSELAEGSGSDEGERGSGRSGSRLALWERARTKRKFWGRRAATMTQKVRLTHTACRIRQSSQQACTRK